MKKIYSLLALAITSVGYSQQYELVTNQSNLVVGSKYIIAAQNTSTSGTNTNKVYVMSTTQNTNNRASVEIEGITTIPTTITYSNSYASFTLGSGTTTISHFTLFDPNHETTGGYLYAASSSNNYLKTQVENNTNGEFTIAINDNGVATIIAQGPNTRNTIRYNGSGTTSLFSCYASGQMDIYLYKEVVEEQVPVTATFNSESLIDFTYVENQATSPSQTVTVTIADLPINETATLALSSTNFTIVSPTELALGNGEHTIELKLTEGLAVGEYTANLTVSHNETTLATLALTGEVTQDQTASTTENNIEGLKVFPNPANELVNITSNEVGTKNIAIYNMLGKKVLETSTEETVNVSTLTSGVYIMNITQDGKNASRKLVIK